MAMFGAIDTAGSGMRLNRVWIDAVSDNIANINTIRPAGENAFQSRMVIAQAVDYGEAGGVRVGGAAFGNPEGRLRYEPGHPYADAEGMVRYPDIDLADQMSQLMIAQRAYQANVAVVERARGAYESALTLGRR
jgi:flagellar basal-body rod protein FlgC